MIDSLFIGEKEEEMTFICPVRGKVTQLVKIKMYKSQFADIYSRQLVTSRDGLGFDTSPLSGILPEEKYDD